MTDSDDKPADDKTVKELIDASTRAELERWFGLPSFQQVAETRTDDPGPEEDPEIVAVRERRQKAIEAVSPAMLEAHRRRVEPPEDFVFKPAIELRVDPDVAMFDATMVERTITIGEPREVEIPDQLRDDLKECTPQAILRDLHRPERDFDKSFDIIDHIAESRVDAVAIVDELMTTKFSITPRYESLFREGLGLLREVRDERMRRRSPEEMAKLPNRRVTE